MATTTDSNSGIGSTITTLETELPQLEARQQGLEKDLAAVTERLEAVRAAVTSLKALNGAVVQLPEPAQDLSAETVNETPVAQEEPAVEERVSVAPESVPAPRRPHDTTTRQGKRQSKAADKRSRTSTTKTVTTKAAKPKQSEVVAARKATATDKQAGTATAKRTRTPGLSKSIVAILAKSKKPLRAGEVNEQLGREKTDASVNSVRTALERLVANRDIQRVGRGLYDGA